MTSKIVLFSFAVVLLAATASAGSLDLGDIYGSDLFYYELHAKKAVPSVVDEEVVHVRAGPTKTIAAIKVMDFQGDGISSLEAGGVGQKEAKIRLVGKRGEGYEFVVSVYAYNDY